LANKLDLFSVEESIGLAFLGLGDAASGQVLRNTYNKEGEIYLPNIKLGKFLTKNLHGENDRATMWSKITKTIGGLGSLYDWEVHALDYYTVAALTFMTSGNPADARLALWKLSYVLSVGFSCLGSSKAKKQVDDLPRVSKVYALSWLFGFSDNKEDFEQRSDPIEESFKNPLQTLSTRAFGYSYRAHINRLKHLFHTPGNNTEFEGKLDHHLMWSSAPLSQSATVMGRFWRAYWVDPNMSLADDDFTIREMGPFPVNARILAYYFKARWYLKQVGSVNRELKIKMPSMEESDICMIFEIWEPELQHKWCDATAKVIRLVDEPVNLWVRALRMLVHCVEAASFFKGGDDNITPPIGLAYYHIWETLREIPPVKVEQLKRQEFFRKEVRQYLDIEFCRTRAIIVLGRMLERHNSGQAFFDHVQKKYFLYDEFSDNYTNVSWAVEYGLIPEVRRMLAKLEES
jgi:hypothetical protein